MLVRESEDRSIVARLRALAPLSASPWPTLAASARDAKIDLRSQLELVGVFDAGGELGVMCRFEITDAPTPITVLVAPIRQIRFDCRHPVAEEVGSYLRRSGDAPEPRQDAQYEIGFKQEFPER